MDHKAETVYSYLSDLGIHYVKHDHPPVFTVEEANQHWHSITGMHCKNLFMRDKKGRQHFLVVVESSKHVNIKALNEQVGERLSFASPERLLTHLDLEPGSVSPFGLINNAENGVIVLLDRDIEDAEEVNFHPNVNTATLTLKTDAFLKFLSQVGNTWQYVQI